MAHPPTIGVLGGGIAGLTAAHDLAAHGLGVRLFEATGRTGGMIRSEHTPEGFVVEHGPNSLRAPTDALARIIRTFDLPVVEAAEAAANRYVVRDGRPVALPSSLWSFLTTPLLSWQAKLRLLLEPLIPTQTAPDESVATFARRRLGPEVLDYALDPFVTGIFAGDARRLSLRHAFRSLFDLEREHGSLVRGLLAKLRDRDANSESDEDVAAKEVPSGIFSFEGGLQRMVDALTDALGDAVHTNAPVLSLTPGLRTDDGRWRVTVDEGGTRVTHAVDAVVCTLPLHRLGTLDFGGAPADVQPLLDVPYPPVSVVAMGFRRQDVAHALDGFGVLVPRIEYAQQILGSIFVSSVFPERAPQGHVLLSTLVGGTRHPSLGAADLDTLRPVVLGDLRALLGIRGEPVMERHVHWARAIPQYELGYEHVTAQLDRLERDLPGLVFAGNFRSGASVGDTMQSAATAAGRVAKAA